MEGELVKALGLMVLAALLSPMPQAIRLRLSPTMAAGGQTFTAADFTYLGAYRLPSSGWAVGADPQPMTWRTVSGNAHGLMVQPSGHGAENAGWGSLYEFTDPGSYSTTWQTSPQGTQVRNWGLTSGGSVIYEMWNGRLGMTWCGTFNQSLYGCTPGTQVWVGAGSWPGDTRSAYSPGGNYVVAGPFWHDDGSGHCCVYLTYGVGYGLYPSDYNLLVADLVGDGNVPVYGPFRTCAGTDVPSGSQNCGPMRGFALFDMPDGTMGTGGAQGNWQQGRDNKGPSFLWGLSWPTSSTTAGYGSNRGSSDYRTTDLVQPHDGVSYYSLDSNINCDGTIISGPNISFRRTASASYGNYQFEGSSSVSPPSSCGLEEIDPGQYSGVGSWNSTDGVGGEVWINTSPKSGAIATATLNVGHGWYRNQTSYTYREKGVAPTKIFQRNADEACAAATYADDNSWVVFQVRAAFYTTDPASAASIKFVNPGVPNQGSSVTHVGNAVTVNLATNGSSVVTTTANGIKSLIEGDSFANTVFAVTPLGTGLGAVDTITTGKRCGGADLPGDSLLAGVLTPAGGPLYCPLHNVSQSLNITGPVSTNYQPAMIIYSTSDLLAAESSGNPDYALDPASVVYFHDIDATIRFNSVQSVGAVWFDYSRNYLFVEAPYADNVTAFNQELPLIHVFSVNTSMPSPSWLEWMWSLAPNLLKKAAAHLPVQFFAHP